MIFSIFREKLKSHTTLNIDSRIMDTTSRVDNPVRLLFFYVLIQSRDKALPIEWEIIIFFSDYRADEAETAMKGQESKIHLEFFCKYRVQ